MPKNSKHTATHVWNFLRALFFCLLCCAATEPALAQSIRRGLTGRVAPSPAMRQYLENLPQKDMDFYVGRIVRKDGDTVIVNIMSPSTVRDRAPMYYACDVKMRPTAILKYAKISHRSCAAFTVENSKTSPGTSDPGVAVYALSSMLSLAGLAALRRRKED